MSDAIDLSHVLARVRELVDMVAADHPRGDVPVALATADADGNPSVRWVLLKEIDARGLIFYTNANSRKGRELAARPRAALAVHLPARERQLRVEGAIEEVAPEKADAYWSSRPRGYQLAGRASAQSEPIASREALVARVAEEQARHPEGPVPRPPHWTGFRILPDRVELWRHRDDRLHEREELVRAGGEGSGWEARLLAP